MSGFVAHPCLLMRLDGLFGVHAEELKEELFGLAIQLLDHARSALTFRGCSRFFLLPELCVFVSLITLTIVACILKVIAFILLG